MPLPELRRSGRGGDKGGPIIIDVEKGEEKKVVVNLEDIMSSDFLGSLNMTSGFEHGQKGFMYQLIDKPPAGIPEWCIGFTDMQSGVIYIVRPAAEAMIKRDKLGKDAVRGLLRHEGGHHAPEVLKLDRKLRKTLGKKELEPLELQEYFTNPEPETYAGKKTTRGDMMRGAFWRAVMSDVFNGVLDVWLEQYITRGTYTRLARHDLLALHQSSLNGRSPELLQPMPLHFQLTQWLVGEEQYLQIDQKLDRETRKKKLEGTARKTVRPEVSAALQELRNRNVIFTLMNNEPHAKWSSTRADLDTAIQRKYEAIIQNIYRTWRSLLVKEFEMRVKFYEQEEKRELTKQEKELVLRQLLQLTEEEGKKAYGSQTPDQADQGELEQQFQDIFVPSNKPGEKDASPPPPQQPSESERAQQLRDAMSRDADRKRIAELAGRFGVSAESLAKANEIQGRHQADIDSLAAVLTEVLVEERHPKTEFARKEGRLTPGLEHVLIGGIRSGKHEDLEIYQQERPNPKLTRVDVEMFTDTSGSMQGSRLELAQTMETIISEAFRRTNQLLEENQLADDEQLRIGFGGFTSSPFRIKKLSERITDSTVPQMIEQTKKISGGTDDAAAIKALYSEFKEGSEDEVIKFLVFASDGEGNVGGMQNMMNEIEKDNAMHVIILALGANASDVQQTYITEARRRGATNIFVLDGSNPSTAIYQLCDYLKKQVLKRKEG